MSQTRTWEFEADDLTIDINQWLLGCLEPGRYRGFDFVPTANMTLTLNHLTTGYNFTQKNEAISGKTSFVLTKQGVVIKEDAQITLPVDNGDGTHPRIDLVVVEHNIVDLRGGAVATYSIIKGTPEDDPEAPIGSVTSTQTIIGRLTIPAGTTQLDGVGVSYAQEQAPAFANDTTRFDTLNQLITSLTSVVNDNTSAIGSKVAQTVYDAFVTQINQEQSDQDDAIAALTAQLANKASTASVTALDARITTLEENRYNNRYFVEGLGTADGTVDFSGDGIENVDGATGKLITFDVPADKLARATVSNPVVVEVETTFAYAREGGDDDKIDIQLLWGIRSNGDSSDPTIIAQTASVLGSDRFMVATLKFYHKIYSPPSVSNVYRFGIKWKHDQNSLSFRMSSNSNINISYKLD